MEPFTGVSGLFFPLCPKSEAPEQPCIRAEPACRYRNPIKEFDVTGREGTQMYMQKRKRLQLDALP